MILQTPRTPPALPRRALLAALGLLALLAVLVPAPPAAADSPDRAADEQVVFIGAPGLAWSDVSRETTPAIWELLDGAVGSLAVRSVRTVTCPLDGWLALGTSTRAAGTSSTCDVLTDPVAGFLPIWPQVKEAVSAQSYSASLGVLHENLAAAGVHATAIGPGAGVALAKSTGHVSNYHARPAPGEGIEGMVTDALASSDLVVIDAGPIRPAPRGAYEEDDGELFRTHQVQALDETIAEITAAIDAAETDPQVILAGLADDGEPALRVLAISGPDSPRGTLTSPSTRQPGYSLATDLQATILTALGAEGTYQGNAVTTQPSHDSLEELVAEAVDRELHSSAMRPIIPTYFFTMVALNVALYAAVAIGLKSPNISRLSAWWARRTRRPHAPAATWVTRRVTVLRAMRIIALAVAALPAASYLANFIPWWRSPSPGLTITAAIMVAIAALVTLSLAGPWRHRPLGPATLIAAVMALILGVDVAVGSPLQLGSVMGNPPLVAGRWYGMNNTAFAQFTTSMILLATAAGGLLVRRGRDLLAGAVILLFGAVTAFIDGAPFLGADFGGPPAVLPTFLIFALLTAGIRLTVKRVGAVFLGTALIVVLIAFVDWLRPPASRSHIGNFFQQVLDGELLTVVWRKLDANLRVLLGNRPLTILALSAVALVVFVLARPIRTQITDARGGQFGWLSGGTPITEMSTSAPLLGRALVSAAILAGLGMALNDSGIAIGANVAAVLVPALIAATATWMLSLAPGSPRVEVSPSPPPDSR